ncbi:DUF664 domain-containing protein [Enterococcus pseudoavium]|uniref:DUF664 domain-containing protein n=1 Tax=Enterococcus pseudoavium TaxID=44007 RepID=A0AAE4L259_9ENTE|nr:DUF664 domain-containing protein [Enterococcus pseudoavium]MDT2737491.1 DUF664 domain-containing protein [Enterococcus pseudoavium]MDT2755645.1 DUF664 domain-containing protein [Enterococcus pseudoavium]MDT2771652.1 DUF664 domain-containing protein [Enterococcus pseudoavium]
MDGMQVAMEMLDRAEERLVDTFNQMTTAEANTMPAPLIKSVTWLMWHTARELDLQISDLNETEALWISAGWTEKFALDLPDDTEDYRHTPEEAAKVVITDRQLPLGYLRASVELTKQYLEKVDENSLADVIDTNWNPPVTRQVRIISIIDDAVMHSGQAVYTRRLVIGK